MSSARTMSKAREKILHKTCVLCSQNAGPKGTHLLGVQNKKSDVFSILEMLLPAQDFSALTDRTIFPDPAICASCFCTLEKIPKTVLTLQNLLGKSLNIQLYKPNRQAWTSSSELPDKSFPNETEEKNSKKAHFCPSESESPCKPKQNGSCGVSGICNDEARRGCISFQDLSDNEDLEQDLKDVAVMNPSPCTNAISKFQEGKRCADHRTEQKSTDHSKSYAAEKQIFINEELLEAFIKPAISNEKDPYYNREVMAASKNKNKYGKERIGQMSHKPGKTFLNNIEKAKKGKERTTLISETVSLTRPVRECTKSMKTRYARMSTSGEKTYEIKDAKTKREETFDFDTFTDISASGSDDDYTPPANKVSGKKTHFLKKENTFKAFSLTRTRGKLPNRKYTNKKGSIVKNLQTQCHLSCDSKATLKDLGTENFVLTKRPKPAMIKCSMDNCSEAYTSWMLLAQHIKNFHFDGSLPDSGDAWHKLSIIAEGENVNQNTYIHKCRHNGCELSFTSERNLKVHSSSHSRGLSQICGFPDCPKAFKLPQALRTHYQSHIQSLGFTSKISALESEIPVSVQKDSLGHKENKSVQDVCGVDMVKSGKSARKVFDCKLCGKHFAKEISLTGHMKKIHNASLSSRHRCPYQGCSESFMKKEKLEIHLCEHIPERRLFCEKCGQSFSCQRYLDVHLKIHIKNEAHASNPPSRTIPCEQEGCQKMFTTRENMKSHVLNQHKGRKPCALPGVFFPCTFPGCGKKFSFRSTLYRHKKLVHKGGDYKLGRQIVQYPCTHDGGCGKVFNRKNLLEEHLVMIHGKSTPRRLLPLRNKALDFTEEICTHCGMVLTQTLLPRHIQLYHKTETGRNLSENKVFPCHLKGCNEILNTQEDRTMHIKAHIASPPYCCQVEECTEVFFLEKNLDNHLWAHSRKASSCNFEGCSQTFDDQLELAKHSKVHYDGKMKCPWPNCDNWLTETGQLRPHFIAHSRALHASGHSEYVCEVCQLAFSSRWGLMIHKRMHGEEAAAVVKPTLPRLAKFCCEEPGCPATFCDQKGFFDHFLYHFTKKPCVCDVEGCNQSFSNLITLSRHTKLHFDGKYQCPWQNCKKLFASPFIVKRHVYRHIVGKSRTSGSTVITDTLNDTTSALNKKQEEDKNMHSKWPLSCSQCFMVFKLRSNLASHMEYHNDKSEYLCPTCGKKGKHNHTKAALVGNKPSRVHTCDQCGAKYSTISGLKFHLLQKHKIGKWPFKCSYCDKGFVSSREMQRHIPSHTKEKPFVCDVCGASFASHTGHRAHMRKHTGEKYVCEVEGCNKVYTTAISLRGHMAQHAGFSKICPYCSKNYKNPYGHKCKASRESKRKLLSDHKSDQSQPPADLSETTLHVLQPSSSGHQQQQPQQHLQPQQVLGMLQQQHQPFQHHHQPQHHPQYLIPHGGALSSTPASFSSLVPNVTPQAPMLTSSTPSSIQQSQMILMAPQMLPGSSGNQGSLALMAIPHGGNNSVPLHHHPQHPHPGMIQQPPSQPIPQSSLPSSAASSLSHMNLLHQGILTIPPQSSNLQVQQQLQQQQQQHHAQPHLNSAGISSVTTILPEGMIPQHPDNRSSTGESSNISNVQGDHIYNNYVVFWEGQV